MSLDYPEYEELRKQSRLLGWLWQVGDKGYYIGLLGAIITPLAMIGMQLTTRRSNLSWFEALSRGLLITAFFYCIFWLSGQLKGFAFKRGEALKNKR